MPAVLFAYAARSRRGKSRFASCRRGAQQRRKRKKWVYVGKDPLLRVYVYLYRGKYVYHKAVHRGWRARLVYVGKLSEELLERIPYSDEIRRKLLQHLRELKMREARVRERFRRREGPHLISVVRDSLELAVDTLRTIRELLEKLDSFLNEFAEVFGRGPYRRDVQYFMNRYRNLCDKKLRAVLDMYELDRPVENILDLLKYVEDELSAFLRQAVHKD